MVDIADAADASIERHLAESLRKQIGKSAAEWHPDFDGQHCIECNDDIAPARLALQRIRCYDCQTLLERRRRITTGGNP